jgi:hypothetical protein
MNDMLNPNILREAMRLTRARQLTEASALLQRMLRGKTAPDMTFGAADGIPAARREPSTIDAKGEPPGGRIVCPWMGPHLRSRTRSALFTPCSIVPSVAPGSDCAT